MVLSKYVILTLQSAVTECNFGSVESIQALASTIPVHGRTILELNNQVNVTTSLAVVVDGVILGYVAVTNQSGHFLLKVLYSYNFTVI